MPPENDPPKDGKCHNCGADYAQCKIVGDMQPLRPDSPGKQQNPFSRPLFVQPNTPINTIASKKKKKKNPLGDYKTEEIKMCKDPVMYIDGLKYDDKDVEKSCLDLEIDG